MITDQPAGSGPATGSTTRTSTNAVRIDRNADRVVRPLVRKTRLPASSAAATASG